MLPALLFVVVGLSGCKKAEIEYYEIPKEKPANEVATELPADHPPMAQASPSGSTMGSLPGFSAPKNQTELDWSIPESWATGAESSMRIASYVLEGVAKSEFDVSVTRFPGNVGGMFSNVNRWRGQLGLDRYTDPAQIESESDKLQCGSFQLHLFSMANEANPPMATEVAILELNGFSWFFKMTGEKTLVDQESEHFRQWILSLQAGDSESQS